MAGEDALRERLLAAVERELPAARELARWMAAHPELSLEERDTAERYAAVLAARGFAVERGAAGLETAFWSRSAARPARRSARRSSPRWTRCPRSATPAATTSRARRASAPRSRSPRRSGRTRSQIVVVGSPAEEIGVGKRRLVAAGVFREIDVAMMAHASDMRRAHRLFLGNRKFAFTFHGRAAHAAAYPERGINALDAVIALFVARGPPAPAAARPACACTAS